ncbi:hypothetical protein [Mycobacterium lepromatosis]|uniref:hypothetical protein n=1 Tax=Mycobacterium lepromatosis TaxID=480418 RepID=UPI0005F860A0|nr:hypothetical protein [Mycobacterium lepromatosis]
MPSVWATLVAGVGFLPTFVYWQAGNTRESPDATRYLRRLGLQSLCNVGAAIVAFATIALLPLMFLYAGGVRAIVDPRGAADRTAGDRQWCVGASCRHYRRQVAWRRS